MCLIWGFVIQNISFIVALIVMLIMGVAFNTFLITSATMGVLIILECVGLFVAICVGLNGQINSGSGR